MGIILRATEKGAYLKACLDDNYSPEDRDRLLGIPNRIAMYRMNPDTCFEEFDYWEVPGCQLEDFLLAFDRSEIEADDVASRLIDDFYITNTPIEDLPKYQEDLFKSRDNKVLREWQENLVRANLGKDKLLLAFDRGLGKTLTSLVRAKTIGYSKLLCIVPKRLLSNWRTAIQNCYGEGCLIYHGTKKKREKLLQEIPNHSIILTNYESVKEIMDQKFDFFIVDEIHILSESSSKIYEAANTLLNKTNTNASRLGLSATPRRLTLENLYNVCYLIDPIWTGRKSEFLRRYQQVMWEKTIKRKTKSGVAYEFKVPIKTKVKDKGKLREKLRSIMVRESHRGKLDFEDLADIIHVDMTEKQSKLYREVLEEVRTEVKLDPANPLVRMLRLLQISEGTHTLMDYCESGKINFVLEDLKDHSGEKACIYFKFLPGTEILHEKLKDKAVLYTGNVSDPLKDYAVWAFNGVSNDEDRERFYEIKEKYKQPFDLGEAQYIISTFSQRSGMGVDLDMSSLNYFLSYDYSHISLIQAWGRIIRLTQEEDCMTKLLVSPGTLEPAVLRRLLKRCEDDHNILDGNEEDANYKRELANLLWEDF